MPALRRDALPLYADSGVALAVARAAESVHVSSGHDAFPISTLLFSLIRKVR